MDFSAIILLNSDQSTTGFAGHHLATIDVLGRSPLLRVVHELERLNVSRITVLTEIGDPVLSLPPRLNYLSFDRNRAAEAANRILEQANRFSPDSLILAIRLCPYAEIDYADLLRFHQQQDRNVTAVFENESDAPCAFVVDTTRRNELAYLIRHTFSTVRHPFSIYPFVGYSNPLSTIADLRRLAIDSFCHNAKLRPIGIEQRPGIWIGHGASIHPRARIVAPAFIGAHSKVRACALVTRCSVLEHHVHVGAGAMVENATLLPATSIGPALDVARAVAGFRRLVDLRRNVEVEMTDSRLLGQVSAAPVRFVEHLASLAAFLPSQFLRGLASSNGNGKIPPMPTIGQPPYPALAPAEQEFPAHLAGVRRYGDD